MVSEHVTSCQSKLTVGAAVVLTAAVSGLRQSYIDGSSSDRELPVAGACDARELFDLSESLDYPLSGCRAT